MEKILILTDTGSELTAEQADEHKIELLPVLFRIDGKPCYEGIDFQYEKFYEMMVEQDRIYMSHIASAVYLDRYRSALKNGYTDVLVITAGQQFAKEYKAAVHAKELLFAQPEMSGKIRVHVVNSGSCSTALGQGALFAAKLRDEGKTADEILNALEALFIHANFYLTAYSMRYVSSATPFDKMRSVISELTHSQPILHYSNERSERVKNEKGDFDGFIDVCVKALTNVAASYSIAYARRKEDALLLAEKLTEAVGFAPELVSQMSASTAYHGGRECISVMFFEK